MNGAHDMGGMQDMGPIRPEHNEPVFHTEWERRVFALFNAVDVEWPYRRTQIELIPPADYLRMSYYERWLTALPQILIKTGMATPAEIESGKAVGGAAAGHHVLTVAEVASWNVPDTSPKLTASALSRRSARPRAKSKSRGAHSTAALRARKNRHDRARWRRGGTSGQ